MAPRKRARTASSSSAAAAETAEAATVTLDGGDPNAPALVELWRAGRLTDTIVTVEGQDFACHSSTSAGALGAPPSRVTVAASASAAEEEEEGVRARLRGAMWALGGSATA